jgi:hypothetical protein
MDFRCALASDSGSTTRSSRSDPTSEETLGIVPRPSNAPRAGPEKLKKALAFGRGESPP